MTWFVCSLFHSFAPRAVVDRVYILHVLWYDIKSRQHETNCESDRIGEALQPFPLDRWTLEGPPGGEKVVIALFVLPPKVAHEVASVLL